MLNKIKSIISNSEIRWTILFQISTLFGGILLIKLLSNILTKEDYGYYALITSISSFILMLPFTAFQQAVSRYISIYITKYNYKSFISTILYIFTLIISIYSIFAYLVSINITIEKTWNNLIIFIIIFITTEIFKIIFRAINNAKRERKNLGISTLLEFFTKIGLILGLTFFIQIGIREILIALSLGNLIAILIMILKNIKDIKIKKIKIKEIRIIFFRLWFFSYPLLVWAPFGWLRDMSNRWYLDYYIDKEAVAIFALMSSIALIIPSVIQSFISNFFTPILYQKENKDKGHIRRYLIKVIPALFLLFLFLFLLVFLFKNQIILLIASEKYISAAWMLPYMFLAYSLYVLSMMSNVEIFAYKDTKKLIYASSIPGIISLIGGYIFIKLYGIEGALYNYMVTYISYAFFTFYTTIRYRS